jgi:hypothetical protein
MDAKLAAAISLDTFDFTHMMAPVSVKEFQTAVLGKKPLHLQGAAGKFDFAMNWSLLNGILNQAAAWTGRTLTLVLDTKLIPPEQFTRPGTSRDGQPAALVDLDRMRAFLRQGASLVLNGAERMTPGMGRIAEILGHEFKATIAANLYCSWKRHQAFSVHFDTHDVFAFQIEGTKAWRIYERYFKDPINHPRFKMLDNAFHAAHRGKLTMEFTMKPGDLVYIPGGFYHEALATSDASIHLSYSVTPMIGLEVLTFLFDHGIEDEILRAPLPDPDRDSAAFNEAVTKFVARAREVLRDPATRAALEEKLAGYDFERQKLRLPAGDV